MITKTAAQLASQEALDYFTGKKKRLNSQIPQITKPKPKNKYPILLIIFAIIPAVFFLPIKTGYKVKGSININKNIASNQEIKFEDNQGNILETETNEKGQFELNLQEGNYKIYFSKNVSKKYLKPETTPFIIKVNRNLENIKIYVPM